MSKTKSKETKHYIVTGAYADHILLDDAFTDRGLVHAIEAYFEDNDGYEEARADDIRVFVEIPCTVTKTVKVEIG